MEVITIAKLSKLLPKNKQLVQWHAALNKFLPQYNISTPERVAAFMSQCMHESANFTAIKENLNYRVESLLKVFPKYFKTSAIATQYANNPEMIANKVYANRMGNGAESSGDGYKYRGRGLIQITGHDNYKTFADSIKMPLDKVPAYLETIDGAIESACWYWKMRNINIYADKADVHGMTKVINGGTNGLDDRLAKYTAVSAIMQA